MKRRRAGQHSRAAGLLLAVGLLGLSIVLPPVTAPAAADTAPAAGTPATVSADALATVQVNGVVWKTAVVGTTVYAVGSFSKARPAGTAPGDPAEVPRANILAFDLATGSLLPFNRKLSAQALTVKASPDGATIYVGGDFTTVDGQARSHIAAFDTATGTLTPFAPSLPAQVRALAVTATTVYAGGVFVNVGAAPRHRLAAFTRTTGALTPWAPSADDDQVEALIAAPDDSRIVVGGRFQSFNGEPQVGIAAVDGATGASLPWSSRPVPARSGTNRSWVTDLAVAGGVVYGGADGEGLHWYDGRFAASFTTGDLVWLDNCYGATYGVFPSDKVLYSVSHAHDCSSLAAFPQTNPATYYRGLAETTGAVSTDPAPPGVGSTYSHQPTPGLLTWFPNINFGTYTGQNQGAWAVTGSGTYVVMGGEFTKVNGVAQQGLVRFAAGPPNKMGPVYSSTLLPTAFSPQAGTIRIAWNPTWDPDNAKLTYNLFRDGGTTPIATVTQAPSSWTTSNPSVPTGPPMGMFDSGLPVGSTHTYRLKVSDPAGNNLDNMRTAPVTVSGTPASAYARDVRSDGAAAYWRLGDSGGTAYDSAGFTDAAKGTGVTAATPGAIGGDPDGAATFDGTANGVVASRSVMPAPAALTIEAWVRTTSTAGGKIVGYGNAATGSSSLYDRHLYMGSTGRVSFGVYSTSPHVLSSPTALNDGVYHHLVGTLDPAAGMKLFVDGVRVGADPTATAGQAYTGYWRIGGDSVGGWPDQPTSGYLAGTIDDVAIYPTALSRKAVLRHFVDSGRPSPVAAAPADLYGSTVYNDDPDAYWRLGEQSGTAALDSSEAAPATYYGGVTLGRPGAVAGTTDTAVGLNGVDAGAAANAAVAAPGVYTVEGWFRSTSTAGGELIGFGDRQSGPSTTHDRQVYLQPDGRLAFTVLAAGLPVTLTSPAAYNDGGWHPVVASQGPAGMAMYVDGAVVATGPQTAAQAYTGFWRLGGDAVTGLSGGYLAADVDEAAVYSAVLSPATVAAHAFAGGSNRPPNVVPTAALSGTCTGLSCTLDASASRDSDGTIASYAFAFGDGSPVVTGTTATVTHAYAAGGPVTATVTVTDDRGATATATAALAPVAPPRLYAQDGFGRTVTAGLGTADLGGAWTLSGSATGFGVDGATGAITAAAGKGPAAYLTAVSSTDTDLQVDVVTDKSPTGSGVFLSFVGRRVPSAGDYRAKVRLVAGGAVGLSLYRASSAGAETSVAAEVTVPGLAYVVGQPLRVRFQTTGTTPTTLRAKVWPVSATEPAAWQASATDSTAGLQAPGGVGLMNYLSTTATATPVVARFDNLTAGPTS